MTCCLQAQLLSCCLGFADHDSVTVMMIPNDSDGQNDSELENNFKSYWQVTNLNMKPEFKSRSAALSPRTGDRRGRKPAFQVVQVTHDNELEASLCEVQVSPSRTSQFRVSPSHGQRGSTRRR
jgi:hypothetical protein